MGEIDSSMKDTIHLVNMIKILKVEYHNKFLLSFNIVSRFTMIYINEEVKVIEDVIDSQTTYLMEISLRSTFFSFKGDLYKYMSGVTM